MSEGQMVILLLLALAAVYYYYGSDTVTVPVVVGTTQSGAPVIAQVPVTPAPTPAPAPAPASAVGGIYKPVGTSMRGAGSLYYADPRQNNLQMYLCQGTMGSDYVTGKTWPGFGTCNVPYNGREVNPGAIQSIVDDGKYSWVPNSAPMTGSYVYGGVLNGVAQNVCRATHSADNSVSPGVVPVGGNRCTISWGGDAYSYPTYDYLQHK